MQRRTSREVRERVVVYLDSRDKTLLAEFVERTGLTRTELFRRGLRRMATDRPGDIRPGGSLERLIAKATEDDLPPDVSARHDDYLGKWLG